jgi:hypothetical protein
VGQRQLADLRVPRLHVHRRGCFRLRLPPNTPAAPSRRCAVQVVIWFGLYVELLRQLGERPLAFYGSQGHLGLEGRSVVPARSSRHGLSCSTAILAAVRQKLHSPPLSRFPGPPLLFSDGSTGSSSVLSVDALGCLGSLRARAALDGVSWVRGGSVEIAVGTKAACYRIGAVIHSLPRASLRSGARFGLLSGRRVSATPV